MNKNLLRSCMALTLALTLSMALDALAQEHQHEADKPAMQDHSAHHAMMKNKRYSVTTSAYDIADTELLNANGDSVSLMSLVNSDKPVALNFIFTTCTTICPVMTATFSQMRRALGDTADDVELVSITIDPEYDRPEVLKKYAEQFGAGPGWTFVTGESSDIERIQRSFDAYAGSKLNHRPLTFLKRPDQDEWVRIDGLASGESLAREVTERLLN